MSIEGSASKSDLEALVTLKVRGAVRAALEKVGKSEFASLSGIDAPRLEQLLEASDAYVPVTVISVACQINKTHNDPDSSHSSLSECLKGTIFRMPGRNKTREVQEQPASRRHRQGVLGSRRRILISDKKSARLVGFGFNTIAFLVLGYFIGGLGLASLLGLSNCSFASVWPPSLTICSVTGVLIGAALGLVYTTYFFARKL